MFIKKYKNLIPNEGCNKFEINNWIISKFILKKLISTVSFKPYPLNELMIMTGTVCRLQPTHIFDWGTHIGKSARIFYETIKYFDIPCEIHTTDLPNNFTHKEKPNKLLRGLYIKHIKGITQHYGDGLDVSLNLYNKAKRHRKKLRPLFFLDGDHKYSTVKNELVNINKYAPEAWILIHDTFFQSKKSNYNIGPYKAIQFLLNKTSNRYKFLSTNTGLPGITLLYK